MGRVAQIAALAFWLAMAVPLAAQVRPLAIKGATILTGDGTTIEGGTVVIQGGKISAVGRKVDVSFMAQTLKAKGKYITPGLIDAHSTLGLGSAVGGGQATATAADAFDRYAVDDIRAALQQGVTAVYLPARGGDGVRGLGAAVRLIPRGAPDQVVLNDKVALCISLGVDGGQGPLARAKVVQELRRRFQEAKNYREAREDYEESVKEYEQKLAERVKKDNAAADKSTSKKSGENKKDTAPAEEKKPDQGQGKDAKKDELQKPAEPAKDRNAEMLLKVLDGELRLRVEAHEPADILNALQIAEEFNLSLILEGGTGAHLVAERLAALKVPVVLSGGPAAMAFDPGPNRYAQADAAAILQRAGVDVYFGSGAVLPDAAPHLALRVARAVGSGWDAEAALTRITSDAAKLLGVEKEIGRLAPGLQADVVIWSDHPLAPGARVERVFVGGQEVYRAEHESQVGDEENP